ncbi:MAG: hypothetical protein KatS3mg060_1019 [Dehalococcoidia bacterium]|nr:MAG: hypothetical protein KatS3mg060_1019 [Dehalococcoidia bacterium]
MNWLAAVLQTLAAAVAILRLVVSAVWLHRWIQRGVSPAWALRRGGAVPEAVVALVLHGGDPRQVWIEKGAPLDDLPAETSRHLPEVHRLLRWVWRVGWLASAGSLLIGRRPAEIASRTGLVSLLVGGVGLIGVVALFPAAWSLYHRLAYANDDWQLPNDVLLAALYPERFYQRAAAIWFAGLILSGVGNLVAGAWLDRRLPRGAQ